ncbi:hypothetical protein DFH09DRAFT_1082831 [Mycena vulgaris]|nr:hypothetical protein DFH09DRAFT_1082831 [Mycena vulgaris]
MSPDLKFQLNHVSSSTCENVDCCALRMVAYEMNSASTQCVTEALCGSPDSGQILWLPMCEHNTVARQYNYYLWFNFEAGEFEFSVRNGNSPTKVDYEEIPQPIKTESGSLTN